MTTPITISGMHCEACQKLIRMELEDAGLDQYIDRFVLQEENSGTLYLSSETAQDQRENICEIINQMDGYSAK